MLTIYEVNLTVDAPQAPAFRTWLPEHVAAMLALDGFVAARWLERWEPSGHPVDSSSPPAGERRVEWTVQYELLDRSALERYLRQHAAAMRAEAIERFGDSFRASRRVFDVVGAWTSPSSS